MQIPLGNIKEELGLEFAEAKELQHHHWSLIATTCEWGHNFFEFAYRKVASTNTFCLGAHPGFFILVFKGTFNAYVLCASFSNMGGQAVMQWA